ncbi:MAG: hypothetical protein QXI58_04395 [Candidatus Micrarchaeia archaeon]
MAYKIESLESRLKRLKREIGAEELRLMQKRQYLWTLQQRLSQIRPLFEEMRGIYYELVGDRTRLTQLRRTLDEYERITNEINKLQVDIVREERRLFELRTEYAKIMREREYIIEMYGKEYRIPESELRRRRRISQP